MTVFLSALTLVSLISLQPSSGSGGGFSSSPAATSALWTDPTLSFSGSGLFPVDFEEGGTAAEASSASSSSPSGADLLSAGPERDKTMTKCWWHTCGLSWPKAPLVMNLSIFCSLESVLTVSFGCFAALLWSESSSSSMFDLLFLLFPSPSSSGGLTGAPGRTVYKNDIEIVDIFIFKKPHLYLTKTWV